MNRIEQFKNDLGNGVWQHAKDLFKPVTIVTIASFILSLLFVFVVLGSFLSSELMDILREPANVFDFEALQDRNQEIAESLIGNGGIGKMISLFTLMMIVFLLVSSWIINFMLIISQQIIEGTGADIGKAFNGAFNKNVLKIIAIYFLVFAIYIGSVLLLVLLATATSPVLMFIGLLFVAAFLLRFSAAYGAIVHGEMTVSESISFSLKNITWGRGFKLLLVFIVVGILSVLIFLLIAGLVSFIGTAGVVVNYVFQIVFNVLFYSLFIAGMSAAFYRYVDVEYESSVDTSDHLLDIEG